MTAAPETFPVVRWVALLWLGLWGTVYAVHWGWLNFLNLCDISVILTCLALWRGDALLLSSQAVSSLFVHCVWTVDVGWRLVTGAHLVRGTEYMFEPDHALGLRLLSTFHVVWPPLLVWALRRTGYDRRGFPLQCVLALLVVSASRFTPEIYNLNSAFRDPLWGRTWGPGPLHVAAVLIILVLVIYWPTHALLRRLLPSAAGTGAVRSAPPPR